MNRHHVLGIILTLIFYSASSQAALTISVDGTSNSITDGGVTAYYYSNIGAAYTATGGACDTNRNATCKTPSSILTLTAKSTATMSGTPKMVVWAGTVPTLAANIIGVSNTVTYQNNIAKDATYTFNTKTFADFCTAAGTAVDCTTDTSISISIIADVDGSGTYSTGDEISTFTLYLQSTIDAYSATYGFLSFVAYPGDAKIYITQEVYGTSFPSVLNANLIGAQKLRFYYQATTAGSEAATLAAMTASGTNNSVSDITLDSNNNVSFSPWYVNGLVNGQLYCVISAVVDKAGNIGMETALGTRTTSMCETPDQVIGLMSHSGQCFIATAAFGSPLADQVDTLRKFRDTYLLKSQMGRNFVSWYYDHSPAWAAKIKENKNLKKLTQTFLWPVVGYSFLSLKWGAANATLFAVTLLLLPLLLLQLAFRKRGNE